MKLKQNDLFVETAYKGTAPFVPGSHTSKEAAKAIEARLNKLERRVFDLLKSHEAGLTDEQGIDLLRMPSSTYRPRRISLVKMGLVKDSGRMAETRSGRWAVVWCVKEQI